MFSKNDVRLVLTKFSLTHFQRPDRFICVRETLQVALLLGCFHVSFYFFTEVETGYLLIFTIGELFLLDRI